MALLSYLCNLEDVWGWGTLAEGFSDFGWNLQNKGISKQQEEDPFDSLTDKIPERPVTVAEGASYSLVILAGLAVAAAAAYAVFKELIFQPREYVVCFPFT